MDTVRTLQIRKEPGLIDAEINLNGGVVSNKGFIRQMANSETSIIEGKYISAWGGIQSAGQTVGQIVLSLTYS